MFIIVSFKRLKEADMDLKNKKIVLTGASGFLGYHVKMNLLKNGVFDIFTPPSQICDLRDRKVCGLVIRGDIVIHVAGFVGGIGLNKEKPYTLWHDNSLMGLNVLDAAIKNNVSKVVIIGTICEYPKFTPVPFREDDLHNGYPEETNAPYGYAKKSLLVGGNAARMEFGTNVIHLLPVNLYGPGDHFEPEKSHVIPALIKKVADAKILNHDRLELWGTGTASREFLYVEDAAEAIVLATENYDGAEPVNIGAGFEITIRELSHKICKIMDFGGSIEWDHTKPDGQPRRCLDVSRAEREFGFKAKTDFDEGLRKTIDWYLSQVQKTA